MADISAITLADGGTTPANRTFTRVSRSGNKVTFRNLATDQIGAQAQLDITVVTPNSSQGSNARISFGMKLPVVATDLNNVTKVARFSQADVVLRFHPDSTIEERKAFAGLVKNLLTNTPVQDLIKNVEPAG